MEGSGNRVAAAPTRQHEGGSSEKGEAAGEDVEALESGMGTYHALAPRVAVGPGGELELAATVPTEGGVGETRLREIPKSES